jgi:hypothetical protein
MDLSAGGESRDLTAVAEGADHRQDRRAISMFVGS